MASFYYVHTHTHIEEIFGVPLFSLVSDLVIIHLQMRTTMQTKINLIQLEALYEKREACTS